MNANSPICASPKAFCTDVFTSSPQRSEATRLLANLPTTTTHETSSTCGRQWKSATGSTRRPIETKKTAENIDLSGSASDASRSRTTLIEPMMPTRNAPSASE